MPDPFGYGVVLTLNRCDNTYGVLPCTASRPVGQECYNCFSTCQDKPNYVQVNDHIRLIDNHAHPPLMEEPADDATTLGALYKQGPQVFAESNATLDPNFTGPGVELSADLLQADFEVPKDFWESTRTTNSHTSGKWWIEVNSDTDRSEFLNVMAGFCVEGQELDAIPGFGNAESNKGHSIQMGGVLPSNDTFYYHGGIQNRISPISPVLWNTSDVWIMLLLDLDAGVFSYVSGGALTTIATGILPDTWYACLGGGGPGAGLNINTGGSAPVNTVPTGYEPWGEDVILRDAVGYPCLTRPPKYTSAHIQRGQGLAVRGGVTLTAMDFVHTDRAPLSLDPYRGTRGTQGALPGTFFPRFKALYPYLQRSPVVTFTYTYSAAGVATTQAARYYVFDTISGPDSRGNVVIKCRDLLSEIDNEDAVTPVPDDAALQSNISPTATTIGITGAGAAWPAINGEFVIKDEAVQYAAFDGINASGCTRGANGTTARGHESGDHAQLVTVYNGVNIVDVLYDLLANKAGIDPVHIPYNNDPLDPDEWDIEKEKYLLGHTITHGIPNPTGINALVTALLRQSYLHMWYEPLTSKIRLAATNVRVAELEATPITEDGDILAGTLTNTQRRRGIITQAWTYYDKINYTLDDSPENYRSLIITVDDVLESANAWGQKDVVVQFASWLTGAGNIAITTNSRTLTENNSPRYELTFQVASDNPVALGEFVTMRTSAVLTPEGTPQDLSCQIIKDIELVPTVNRQLTATIISVFDPQGILRFGHIVNVANETVDYDDADQASKDAWGWISTISGFANGDEPYLIL